MTTINIKVNSVAIEKKDKGQHMTVSFESLPDGKHDGKKLVEFYTAKEVWAALAAAKQGDFFSIDRAKNEAGYWQWTGIARQDSPPKGAPAQEAPATKGSTWAGKNELDRERFEHDKTKQPLIIRQSCLSSATTLAAAMGLDSDETLKIAQKFVDWVNEAGIAGLKDDKLTDVPY